MIELGDLNYFPGIKVKPPTPWVPISHSKQIIDILEKNNMTESRLISSMEPQTFEKGVQPIFLTHPLRIWIQTLLDHIKPTCKVRNAPTYI